MGRDMEVAGLLVGQRNMAEKRELEDMNKDVKKWLDKLENEAFVNEVTKNLKVELQEWTYDADDILEDWEFEQLHLRAKVEAPIADPPIFDPIADPSIFDQHFVDSVNILKLRFNDIWEWKAHSKLREEWDLFYGEQQKSHQPISSIPTEPEIRGREPDKESILEFLLNVAPEYELSVVPVMGAAGIGKTTLLQHIYNDPSVSDFSSRQWVSGVGDALKLNLDGQKLLLVLEDVTYKSIEEGQWEKLLKALKKGCAKGSVVILPTQDERVADKTKVDPVPVYILESLSSDPCWSVFRKYAFSSFPLDDTRLAEIGKKIANACEGSPLVAKALGMKLRHEPDVARWEELLLHRDLWHEVVQPLRLTYYELPAHLKRCFVYCSMFPQGYLFSREELSQLWKAQGFVKELSTLEDLGLEYFDKLYNMSFFQESELDPGAFVTPNVLHALAQSISNGECLTTDSSNLAKLPKYDLSKTCHLSLRSSDDELSTNFLCDTTNLRSFIAVSTWPVKSAAQISLSEYTFRYLKHLRVLDLRDTDIEALPSTISMLKHLRYLNLSGSKIGYVDASVFQLYHLQTLDLSRTNVKEMPDAIGNLGKLLNLRLNVTNITKLPESIGKLSELDSLHLGLAKIQDIPESLRCLKRLRYLCLNVSRVAVLPDFLCGLSSLQILDLQGTGYEGLKGTLNLQNVESAHREVGGMEDGSAKCNLLDTGASSSNVASEQQSTYDNLQMHTNTQWSHSSFHDDQKLWNRIREPSISSNLARLEVNKGMKCTTLPHLGQLPVLKVIFIDGVSVEHVGKEFCGCGSRNAFPRLEKLSFQNMSECKKWDGVEESDFPNLKELLIFNCPKLREVPCFPSSLTKLKMERCALESITTGDSLEELELIACDGLVTLPSFGSHCNVTLMYCQNVSCFPNAQSMETFWIEDCEKLVTSLLEELQEFALSPVAFASPV